MIAVNRRKILPDVILFNFLLFVHFMFISKVFKLQFRLQSSLPSEARHRQLRKSLIGKTQPRG